MSQRASKSVLLAVFAGSLVGACGGGSDTTPDDTTCVADGVCDDTCTADPDCAAPGTGGTGGSLGEGAGGAVTAGGMGGVSPSGGAGQDQTGGAPAAGGAPGAGGTPNAGGTPSAGGTPGAGGASGDTGGATGETGGATGDSGGTTGDSGGTTGDSGGTTGDSGGTTGDSGGTTGDSGGTTGDTGGSAGAAMGGASTGGAGTGGAEPTQPDLVTSTSGAYWVTTGTLTEVTGVGADVTVDEGTTAQTWEGFCGAFNEMGWDYLLMLTESDRDRALQLLFGTDGCHFTQARIPIGSSDYGMDRYTLDEVPVGETDLTMSNFSIARDEQLLIPFVQAAQVINSDIYFWASPWTPPTWMKEGPYNDDSPFDGGSINGDPAVLAALAQYFVLFVQGYAQHGIDIQMVAPQNEPGYSGTYPTCAWAPEAYRDFVGQHLGPALTGAGLDTAVMLGTFNGGSGDTDIISTVMGDPTAASYIDVIGYQWGMVSSVASSTQQHGVPVWQTEHQCGNYPWQTATFVPDIAPNDHAYAVESWGLMRDWINAGVTSYGTWNMVLDTVGNGIDSERFWPQNALLTVDTSAGTLNITPTYYVFRHFSQFVEPGATVVATSGGDAVAFRNPDGTIVTVMYNSGGPTTYVLSVGGQSLQFDIPGDGWATVVH